MTCDKCDKYKLMLACVKPKWELRDYCCGTDRYRRDLRHRKKVPSYISYKNECEEEKTKKILNEQSYILKNLNSEPFKNINPPIWCPKKGGKNE